MDSRYFSKKVVEWYALNKRSLPWRETKDPYKIWLSEVILQQTRVAQGLPYYNKFVNQFPTVFDLARASEQSVLRLWQGLGYYSRARNLHKCAKVIVAEYDGIFPSRFDELKKLPGIGDYTAAAIASFCFQEEVAVVDGNVYRVLARIYGITTPSNSPDGKKQFFELANTLIQGAPPEIFNQAIMEFGAIHCTPQNPACTECPFSKACIANKTEQQSALPVKNRIKKIQKRYFYYLVIKKGNSLIMKKREEKDIWHGLYDFHLLEKKRATNPERLLAEEGLLKKSKKPTKKLVTISNVYKHVLSHQVILARFIIVDSANVSFVPDHSLYSFKKISHLPKPVLISRFLTEFEFL